MRNILKKIIQNYHIVFLVAFFAVMLVLHQNLYLRNLDDNFYNVIGKCDIKTILEFLKWHYYHKNGRIWIHFLTVLFLKFDVYLWRIANPMFFTLLVYFTGDLLTDFFGDKRKSIALATVFYLIIDYSYITSAVYWLASSFNYLIPMLMFVLLLLSYRKNRYIATWICVLFTGFGTEQSSMMTIGFFVLTMLYKLFFIKEKRLTREISYICVAAVGLITVLALPGLKVRADLADSGEISLISLVTRFNDIIYSDWLCTEKSFSFILIITVSTILSLLLLKKQKQIMRAVDYTLACIVAVLCMVHLLIILLTGEANGLLYYAFLLDLVFCLLYSSVKFLIDDKEVFPLIMLILAVGSQVMLSVTNTWIFRTCFPAIVCFSMYSLFILAKSFEKFNFKKSILVFVVPLLLVLFARNVYGNISYIVQHNSGVESFCQNEATREDYEYVISNAQNGRFWYAGEHDEFFKGKIK